MNKNIDFIGIGAARCGTSWISNVLRAHPDICHSEPKEVRYFNRFKVPVGKNEGRKNPNFDRDFEWYLRHFRHAKEGQLVGEISPVYLIDEAAPRAIYDKCPHAKLIACLRNPVDRAYSSYKLHRSLGEIGDISFEDALRRSTVYVDMSMYSKQLERFLTYYRSNDIHIIIFEKLIKNPQEEFGSLYDFLGVVPINQDYSEYHTNESTGLRSTSFHRLASRFNNWLVSAGMSSVSKGLRNIGVHDMLNRANSAPVEFRRMEEQTRAKLFDQFRQDITQLEATFSLDLACWK